MVQVSDRFKSLALQNGRRVYAKVVVGDEVFLDDRLMEFTLDDVTHPDWYTVGTTCANRFHFVARCDNELPSGAELRPYVSFDGEEWCPLGVFFISRRYVRRGVVSVTAYDRMYGLDMEYRYTGSLPTDSAELMKDICAAAGLDAVSYGNSYPVERIPDCVTVRDMIGYIAALDRACAKFDREGRLTLRHGSAVDYYISDYNCMDIRRDLTRSYYTAISADTGTEVLTAGSGSELTTMELYDPLMTQDILDDMLPLVSAFSFYGAEIVMQGLPYLESGEALYIIDGKEIYPIIVGEIELSYNGGLTARISSRNKTHIDAIVHEDDLENELDRLEALISALSMKYVNTEQLRITPDPVVIADFTFKAAGGAFSELHLNTGLSQSTADFVVFRVYVNGNECDRSVAHTPDPVSRCLVSVYHLEQGLPEGECRIHVTAQTGSGEAYILPKALLAGLVVHGGISAQTGDSRDRLVLTDKADPVCAVPPQLLTADAYDELYTETEES